MSNLYPKNSLLICTGVPVDRASDRVLADYASWAFGAKIIMGGTTASVISREMNLELKVCLDFDPSGLPSHSEMEGFDLVCEGVLTLTSIRDALLEGELISKTSFVSKEGIKYKILRLLDAFEHITVIEGLRKNPAYDNLQLPVKIAPRDVLVSEIIYLLKQKYNKHIEHIRL